LKLLITGGCGFLGSNLSAHALTHGAELLVFDNLSRNGSEANLAWLHTLGSFRLVRGDIRDRNVTTDVISNFQPDVIFHLAGQVAMTTSIADPRLDFEINVIGSHNLLESVRLHAPRAVVIYSSTNKVYGNLEQFKYSTTETRYICTDRPNGFDEATPLEFHSPYGCSKGAADQYMLDYARIFGLNTVVFRHSSMYGGRQFATYDQGWIGWFCQKAVEAKARESTKPFSISGNGKQVRDLLHADDMVNLYFTAADKFEAVRGQVFNIGGGMSNSLSILELFSILEQSTSNTLVYNVLPPRESDQRVFVADITKANSLLDWYPRISAKEGIKKMLDWTKCK
jgi:CDP-paratose 2-epimerase